MASVNQDVISTLNDLIATCLDSEEGFGKAAKGAHSDEWRERFIRISGTRGQFVRDLAAEVRRLGGVPVTAPHFGGILRRGWVDLETRIRPKSDEEFLADCARGEAGTLSHYRSALERTMPPETRGIVEMQARDVETTVQRLRGAPLHAGIKPE